MWLRRKNLKNAAKTHGENMGFETTDAKIGNFVLHDNENFRPQKLNITRARRTIRATDKSGITRF